MADPNPPKRRKISPSTDLPITDAPSSPSKIPLSTRQVSQSQDGTHLGSIPRRPSFASPTKASLARHNPQIMHQIGPSGRYERVNTDASAEASGVKDSIENALEGTEEVVSQMPKTPVQVGIGDAQTTGREGNNQTRNQGQTPEVRVGGSMASAPRRRSRTPGKPPSQTGVDTARSAPRTSRQSESQAEQREPMNTNLFGGIDEEELLAGPVRRPALRRSPPAGSHSQSESQSYSQPSRFSPTENPDTGTAANIGIVRKPALRRSPRRSPPTASQPQSQSQSQSQKSAEKIDTGPGPIRKSALRRSPPQVSSQIEDQIPSQAQPTEDQAGSESRAEPDVEPTQNTPTHTRHDPSDIQAQNQDGEPELPPTPVQRGLEDPVVTTPPTGIHDTPSKRRSKKPSKPSPLKPQVQSHSQAFSASMAPNPLPNPYTGRSTPVDATTQIEDTVQGQEEDFEMTGVSRHGPKSPPDKYATKRKLRDDLLQELQELQADISLAESENERLYKLHESGSEIETAVLNQSKIEELLKRSGYGNGQNVNEEKSRNHLSSFHALSSLMPFSAAIFQQPHPKKNQDEDPIPSHLPLPQENPLPYLQLFTPLEFTSVITVVPSYSDPDISILSTSTSSSTEILKDIVQSHTITARSPGSSSLFRATISILVNTTTFSITSVKINSLSPMAKHELGTFLKKISDAGDDDVLAGNVSTLFWAMGRWYEVAKKRAIFWVRIEEEFGPRSQFATRPRKNKWTREKAAGKKPGRKRKDPHEDTEGGNTEEDADNQVGNAGEDETHRKFTRKDYISNMGRQSTILSIPTPSATTPNISLRFEWKISFDWTGEVENDISVGVLGGKAGGWPGSWRKSDTRNCLSKLPATFDRMVRERGPLSAVRDIVELLEGA